LRRLLRHLTCCDGSRLPSSTGSSSRTGAAACDRGRGEAASGGDRSRAGHGRHGEIVGRRVLRTFRRRCAPTWARTGRPLADRRRGRRSPPKDGTSRSAAIARVIREGAPEFRPRERRDWDRYARRAVDFALGVPRSPLADHLAPRRDLFLRLEGGVPENEREPRRGGPQLGR
jgi:hypothetical protein